MFGRLLHLLSTSFPIAFTTLAATTRLARLATLQEIARCLNLSRKASRRSWRKCESVEVNPQSNSTNISTVCPTRSTTQLVPSSATDLLASKWSAWGMTTAWQYNVWTIMNDRWLKTSPQHVSPPALYQWLLAMWCGLSENNHKICNRLIDANLKVPKEKWWHNPNLTTICSSLDWLIVLKLQCDAEMGNTLMLS